MVCGYSFPVLFLSLLNGYISIIIKRSGKVHKLDDETTHFYLFYNMLLFQNTKKHKSLNYRVYEFQLIVSCICLVQFSLNICTKEA